jgi:hypothetical protein
MFSKFILSLFTPRQLILIALHQLLGIVKGDAAYAQISPVLAGFDPKDFGA